MLSQIVVLAAVSGYHDDGESTTIEVKTSGDKTMIHLQRCWCQWKERKREEEWKTGKKYHEKKQEEIRKKKVGPRNEGKK